MPETTKAERALTPLLTLISEQSLDEDYQRLAEKRASAPEQSGSGASGDDSGGRSTLRRHWTAMVVVGVFGLLVAVAAVQTSERSGVADASRQSLLTQIDQRRDEAGALQRRIVKLRANIRGLQEALSEVTEAENTATTRVARLGGLTGFGAVSGPGVQITVEDAPDGEPVRAEDLALLVNGLWEGGAEAIAINGKRLTARSSLSNSGAAINLNGPPPLSPPYVVSAIGDNRTLQADLLDTSTGLAFSNLADALGFEVTMQNVDDLTLPGAAPRPTRHAVAITGDDRKHDAKENAP